MSGEEATRKATPKDEVAKSIKELGGAFAEVVVALRDAHATIKQKEDTISGLQRQLLEACKAVAESNNVTLKRQLKLEQARSDHNLAKLKAENEGKDKETTRQIFGHVAQTAKTLVLAHAGTPAPDSEIVVLAQEVFLAISLETRAQIVKEVGMEKIVKLLAAIGLAM